MSTYLTKFIHPDFGAPSPVDNIYVIPSAAANTHSQVTLHSLSVSQDSAANNANTCYVSIWKCVNPSADTGTLVNADWELAFIASMPQGVPKMANAHVTIADIEGGDRIAIGFTSNKPTNISGVDDEDGWTGRIVNIAYSYTDKIPEMANL